jgi:outer membrane autotransporter protein
LTPFLGITVAHDNVGGFTESDPSGSGAALKVGSSSGNSLASDLGARVEAKWGAWTPEVSLAWEHEFLNPVLSVTNAFAAAPGVSFTELSSNPGSDWAVVGVGTTYTINPSNAVTLKYDGRFASGYSASAVVGRWDVHF